MIDRKNTGHQLSEDYKMAEGNELHYEDFPIKNSVNSSQEHNDFKQPISIVGNSQLEFEESQQDEVSGFKNSHQMVDSWIRRLSSLDKKKEGKDVSLKSSKTQHSPMQSHYSTFKSIEQAQSSSILKNQSSIDSSLLDQQLQDRKSSYNRNMFFFAFTSRRRWNKFEDWFWLQAHRLYWQHAYVKQRPSFIKNMACVLALRIFLFLLQLAMVIYMITDNLNILENFVRTLLCFQQLGVISNTLCFVTSALALLHIWSFKSQQQIYLIQSSQKELRKMYRCCLSWKWFCFLFELSLIMSTLNFIMYLCLRIPET